MVRTPYPAVVRLHHIASERWAEVEAAYPTVSLLRFPRARFLNLVYVWAIERVPSDTLEQWKADLVEPLPWQSVDSEYVIQMESDAFFDMMGKG